jgi:hypothetical protein
MVIVVAEEEEEDPPPAVNRETFMLTWVNKKGIAVAKFGLRCL